MFKELKYTLAIFAVMLLGATFLFAQVTGGFVSFSERSGRRIYDHRRTKRFRQHDARIGRRAQSNDDC
jgi:hypothetical protein